MIRRTFFQTLAAALLPQPVIAAAKTVQNSANVLSSDSMPSKFDPLGIPCNGFWMIE